MLVNELTEIYCLVTDSMFDLLHIKECTFGVQISAISSCAWVSFMSHRNRVTLRIDKGFPVIFSCGDAEQTVADRLWFSGLLQYAQCSKLDP